VRKLVLLGNQAVEVNLDRRDFEAAIGGLLERAEAVTLKCIEDAGLRPADVDCILLVGGSSLVPAVGDRMRKRFTRPGQRVLFHEPSKAVAFGAALHASQLAGEADLYQLPPEFKGVTGYAVGVRTLSLDTGRVAIDTIIRKNMPLPVRVKKTYFTTRPNQDRIVLELVQFREGPADAVSLGQLVVGPLPAPRQNYPIEVTVENREDGTVSVQAYDSQTGVELNQVFGRDADGGLSHLASQRALVRSTFINNG
jgi:molecular chaperone DnaK